ncbi:CmlA/FloR family chloramphenicol efflux MFS transporter, partial [Salmonella enterica subsp. enterica serovar Bovismorbificans]|nr:CmlA/FloR family chloramphenicol efflux MFS transporter [Salmonella enterica subsp. enterica serovar Bovismorbificans]EGX0808495.1 CmlA/FloR family chloramphenicol efflux MFS transporter [Salmonella enterica subsp. enterica serovar Typhimurium]
MLYGSAAKSFVQGDGFVSSKNFSWRYSLAATVLLLSPFDLLASL